MTKTSLWFEHDCDAISDMRIQCLLSDHGAAGYGIYWLTVEMLHSEEKLPFSKITFQAIAKQLLSKPEQIEATLKQCINDYNLFYLDGDFFRSRRVDGNISRRNELSNKRRESGRKGGISRAEQAIAKQVQATAKQSSSKSKQSQAHTEHTEHNITNINLCGVERVNKSKFIPPTPQEIANYVLEKNLVMPEGVDADYIFNFYDQKDWFVGKKKMVRWQSAVNNATKWEPRKSKPAEIYNEKPKEKML